MNAALRNLQPVAVDDLPLYPISVEDRLDSHYFIQWNLKRWRGSQFRRLADPEVGWAWFQLINAAQDETPIGTLPTNEVLLAECARVSLEKWRQLCERTIAPLHKWHKVICDNGEIRWAHHVVQLVAQEALEGRARHQAANDEKAVYARLKRVREAVIDLGCDKTVAADDTLIKRLDEWLTAHCVGRRRKIDYERALMHAQRERWFDGGLNARRS